MDVRFVCFCWQKIPFKHKIDVGLCGQRKQKKEFDQCFLALTGLHYMKKTKTEDVPLSLQVSVYSLSQRPPVPYFIDDLSRNN